jgi:hypothetical protein
MRTLSFTLPNLLESGDYHSKQIYSMTNLERHPLKAIVQEWFIVVRGGATKQMDPSYPDTKPQGHQTAFQAKLLHSETQPANQPSKLPQ